MKEKIYNYLYEYFYSLPSCNYCHYFDSSPKRPPCNKCHGGDKYKFSKKHQADLVKMARDICKIVKQEITS